jgi:hypothetical protein
MLGNLREDGADIWLRPSTSKPLVVKVTKSGDSDEKSFAENSVRPGVEQRVVLNGLTADTEYNYFVYVCAQHEHVHTLLKARKKC